MIYNSEYPVCPRCGSENYTDSYGSNSKCENQYCFACGYSRQFRMIKGNGKYGYSKSDGTKHITTEIFVGEERISMNPYGAYQLTRNDDNGINGTLETKKDYDDFVSEISSEINQKHNIKSAIVSMLVDGKIVKEVIFPETV